MKWCDLARKRPNERIDETECLPDRWFWLEILLLIFLLLRRIGPVSPINQYVFIMGFFFLNTNRRCGKDEKGKKPILSEVCVEGMGCEQKKNEKQKNQF